MPTLRDHVIQTYGKLPTTHADKRRVVSEVLDDRRSFGFERPRHRVGLRPDRVGGEDHKGAQRLREVSRRLSG
jgi:hypothetical protein